MQVTITKKHVQAALILGKGRQDCKIANRLALMEIGSSKPSTGKYVQGSMDTKRLSGFRSLCTMFTNFRARKAKKMFRA